VLVNSRFKDAGNTLTGAIYGPEQNSQFEPTVAVLGDKVVVAYVDSNQGVYGLGSYAPPERIPGLPHPQRRLGYAVSRNGGVSFEDRDEPPAAPYGDGGDPAFAVDRASGVIYLAGTSPDRFLAGEAKLLLTRASGGDEFTAGCWPVVAVNPDPAKAHTCTPLTQSVG